MRSRPVPLWQLTARIPSATLGASGVVTLGCGAQSRQAPLPAQRCRKFLAIDGAGRPPLAAASGRGAR
eukprot:7682699-Alexandrium_andersonii.AAC.1